MKAGLKYADRITTVSPTYAREIATPEFGCGLDGVIRGRVPGMCRASSTASTARSGTRETDTALAARYYAAGPDRQGSAARRRCRRELGLDVAGRRAAVRRGQPADARRRGWTWCSAPCRRCCAAAAQLRAAGHRRRRRSRRPSRRPRRRHPGRVAVRIGYDEALAHRLIAGADVILVPSRFEPCGLTQLYGLRYGTLPLVRRVGGLADTVVDAADAVAADRATGFGFDAASRPRWNMRCSGRSSCSTSRRCGASSMLRAMAQDFSWDGAARKYLALYAEAAGVRPVLRGVPA